jgi:hypothetical protein
MGLGPAIIPNAAKRFHRKGDKFHAGPRAGAPTGRIGIWYFDTRDVASQDLSGHLQRIVHLLYPATGNLDRVNRLRQLLLVWEAEGGRLPSRMTYRGT